MFDVHQLGDASVIDVTHDVDTCTSSIIEATIERAAFEAPTRVVVSSEIFRYFDASGRAVSIRARKRLGSKFFFVVPSHTRLRRIFASGGLEESSSLRESLHRAVMPSRLPFATDRNAARSLPLAS